MTLPYSFISIALYQLKFKLKLKTSQDQNSLKALIAIKKLNHADALALATRMHKAQEIAKTNMEKA